MKNNAKHFMSYALQMFCMKYGVTSIVIVIFFLWASHTPLRGLLNISCYKLLNGSWALLTCNYLHAFNGM